MRRRRPATPVDWRDTPGPARPERSCESEHERARRPEPRRYCSTPTRSTRTLSRIAHELIEANPDDLTAVALVGIHTRGVPLAQRLAPPDRRAHGEEVDLGALDITFYRDDVQVRSGEAPMHAQPLVRATTLDFPLEG